MCPKCNFHNYRSKAVCVQCMTVMPKSQGDAPPGVSSEHFKSFKLMSNQIKALIGKGGETIRAVREQSGATIKIDHSPNETQGTVTIIGDVRAAESLIKFHLDAKNVSVGGSPMPPPPPPPGAAEPLALANQPAFLAPLAPIGALAPPPPRAPAPLPPPGAPAPPPPALVAPVDVPLPPQLARYFLDPSETTIMDIKAQCAPSVLLSVLPPAEPGGPHVVRLQGDGRGQARAVVQGKVEEMALRHALQNEIARQPGALLPLPSHSPSTLPSPTLAWRPVSAPLVVEETEPPPEPEPEEDGPDEINVPGYLVADFIGPGGANLNDIRAKVPGVCYISVRPPSAPNRKPSVRILGDGVKEAERLVRASIEELKKKPPPPKPKPPRPQPQPQMPPQWLPQSAAPPQALCVQPPMPMQPGQAPPAASEPAPVRCPPPLPLPQPHAAPTTSPQGLVVAPAQPLSPTTALQWTAAGCPAPLGGCVATSPGLGACCAAALGCGLCAPPMGQAAGIAFAPGAVGATAAWPNW